MRVGGVKAPVNRVQLTSDGNKSYLDAVERAFGGDINYAMHRDRPARPEAYPHQLCRSGVSYSKPHGQRFLEEG
jgi:hypothetical protein